MSLTPTAFRSSWATRSGNFEPLERAFILVHEILHVALRHCPRGLKIARRSAAHAYVWNLACDAILNHALSAMSWLQTPQKGVFFDKILTPEKLEERPPASWNAEELYRELLEQIGLPEDPAKMDAWLDEWLRNTASTVRAICASTKARRAI
jgi:predicted metal-dependent peptidase